MGQGSPGTGGGGAGPAVPSVPAQRRPHEFGNCTRVPVLDEKTQKPQTPQLQNHPVAADTNTLIIETRRLSSLNRKHPKEQKLFNKTKVNTTNTYEL